MAAGVVPQSSCSLSEQAPASTISISPFGFDALPLPESPKFIGKASIACSMRSVCQGARRAGRRQRAVRGAGAAAEHGRHARHQRFLDLLRADEVDVRVEAAGREDLALARDRLRARADDDRHARLRIGIAGLADGRDAPVPQTDISLVDAGVVDDQRVGDDRVDGAFGCGRAGIGPCRRE